MGANTGYLNLYLASGGSSGDPAGDENYDVDNDNNNMRKIDTWASGIGPKLADTGWLTITSTGSAVVLSGAQACILNGVLYTRGLATKSAGYATGDSIGGIPTAVLALLTANVRVQGWFGSGGGVMITADVGSGHFLLGGTAGESAASLQTLQLGPGNRV